MEDVRLYLNGKLVDIDPNTKISETKQINNLFELQDRQNSFTKNFNVLLTKQTLEVLDDIGKPYNRSKTPYSILPCQLYRGTTCIIGDGFFKIQEVVRLKNRESAILKGNIASNNFSLFKEIDGKKLNELQNLLSLNHRIDTKKVTVGEDAPDIAATRTNTWENGYIYLKSFYGARTEDLFYDGLLNSLQYFIYPAYTWNNPPSIFLKWLWEQIFLENDFTYEYIGINNPLDSDHFKSKVITIEKPRIYIPENGNDDEQNNGIPIEFEKLFENTTQKDILKQVFNMYGLVFRPSKHKKKHYEFTTLKDLLSVNNGYVDYSDKLQRTNSIKFSFGKYAQENYFEYELDEELSKTEEIVDYLRGKISVSNKSLKKETTIVKSAFKSVPIIYGMNFYEVEIPTDDEDRPPKLKVNNTTPYILNNNNGNGDFTGMFWNDLIDAYYKSLSEALEYQELREVELALTAEDVRNFNFFKLVYLRQYQAYYYCNKIKNYTGGKMTKVELIRVSGI